MNHTLKKKIVYVFQVIGGNEKIFSLEQRLFNVMVVLSVFIAFVGAYHNYVLKLHAITIYPSIIGGGMGICFYYKSRIKRHYRETYIYVLALLTMFIISIVFFNNSGSSGPILLLLLSLFNVYIIISNGKHQLVLILLLLANVFFLCYVEYVDPEWIITYTSTKERFWDVLVTFTNASIFMFVGTIVFKRSYNSDRKKVSNQNKELVFLNQKIEGQKTRLKQQTLELEQNIEEIKGKNEFIYSLIKEVNHRVKNNLQLVSSLLNTQELQTRHIEVKDALKMAKNRIVSISLIHQKLYKDDMELSIALGNYVEELAEYLIFSGRESNPVNYKIETVNIQTEVECAVHVGLIINELITNSLKHAWSELSKTKNIEVKMEYDKGTLTLIVKDNGIGFAETAPVANSDTFGLELVHSITEQYDGSVRLLNSNGAQVEIKMLVNTK